jgi:hypothetical protein
MDTAQILLIVVIVALTVLFVALGVQVFFILREFQKTVRKANKVLDDTGVITESISGPVSNLSMLSSGIKAGAFIASLLQGKKKKHREE